MLMTEHSESSSLLHCREDTDHSNKSTSDEMSEFKLTGLGKSDTWHPKLFKIFNQWPQVVIESVEGGLIRARNYSC